MSGSVSTATAYVLRTLLIVLVESSMSSSRSPSSGLRISPLTRTLVLCVAYSWPRLKKQPGLRASTYGKRTVRSQFWLMRVRAVMLRGSGPAALLGVAVIVIVEYSDENAALSAACSVIVVAVLWPGTGLGANVAVMPVGSPVTLNVTSPLDPLTRFSVSGSSSELPWSTSSTPRPGLSAMSGGAGVAG